MQLLLRRDVSRVCTATFLAFTLLATSVRTLAAEGWPGVRHVVIIGIDGLSPLGVEGADAPVLHGLLREGAFTLRARAHLPTSSSTNWVSMLTGATPEVHGVTSNEWERDDHSVAPACVGPEGIYPTVFARLRVQRPDAIIAAVFHWRDFDRLAESGACDVYEHHRTAESTTDRAAQVIRAHRPTLLFVHLDHVDAAGHASGWHTPAYFAAVAQADAMVGSLLAALGEAGMREHTLIIVTSDHGGVGRSHGGESMQELEIPWIVAGPSIARGRRILSPVLTNDTAATAAAALGFRLAPSATGRPVLAARADVPDGPEVGRTTAFVPRPVLSPPAGRFVGMPGHVELTRRGGNGVIRYTLDGTVPTVDSPVYDTPLSVDRDVVVSAVAFDADGRASEVVQEVYRHVRPVDGRGASVQLFQGRFRSVAELYSATPVRTTTALEFDIEDIKPPVEAFGAIFRASILIEVPGVYRFWTESDDGSKLLVNGRTVVDNDGEHGPRRKRGSIDLAAGRHELEVLYFNATGSGLLRVFMAAPTGRREVLRHESLTPLEP
ncbi:MAG: alkaline phosphatase family protein [Tepidisphaerales bacterium]